MRLQVSDGKTLLITLRKGLKNHIHFFDFICLNDFAHGGNDQIVFLQKMSWLLKGRIIGCHLSSIRTKIATSVEYIQLELITEGKPGETLL